MFFPVLYQKDQIDITNDILKNSSNAGLISVVGKAQEWDYEKEWRMISFRKNNNPYLYFRKEINSITLGIRCIKRNKDKVCEWASKKGVKIYQATILYGKYEIVRNRII